MKTAAAIKTALEVDHAIKAIPEVIVDWNMNRYATATADNTPAEEDNGYDVEIFPIDSIVRTNRPGKGINKARVGTGSIGEDYRYNASGVRNGRYYIADVDDTYKYWTSPEPSNGVGVIANVKPQVVYSTSVRTNKIVIGTENSWASAKTFSIQVTTAAAPTDAQWTTVATQATIGTGWKASGRMVLYYNGNGTALTPWVASGRVDNSDGTPKSVLIRGVRIVVSALECGYKITRSGNAVVTDIRVPNANGVYVRQDTTGFNSFFDLIEISARLEVDLSQYVVSTSTNMDMSEVSALYPIGTTTSNQASITLSNLYENSSGDWVPGLFSKNNSNSPYKDYIEANAEFTCSYNYYNEAGTFLGKVQDFKMYSDSWSGQSDDNVTVELTDFSKFFDTNEATLRAAMWEELSVPEIVWRIMDSIGFTDYAVDYDSDRQTDHTIPIFYTTGEQSVWEVLDELSEASQTAIYFDSFGILQVKTRDFAFSAEDAPVWNFTSEDDAGKLANIIDLEIQTEFEPNHYKVTYQNMNWSAANKGQPTMQQVWEPETENVVLRATPLLRTMDANANYFWVSPDEVRFWPYEGMVNIQGELMRFKGKVFIYYTGTNGNTRNTMIVDSEDDFKARNSKTPLEFRHKNHFNGGVFISERGVWNSEPRRHAVEAEGYSVHQIVNGNSSGNVSGFSHRKDASRVQLLSGFSKVADYRLATRGLVADTPFFNYGTRFRFLKDAGRVSQRAGIVIHNSGAAENGYYFEFTPSSKLGGQERANRQELIVYSRVANKHTRLGDAALAIAENIDYEVDISYTPVGGDHVLGVWVNGKNVFNKTVTGDAKATANGKFGMFVRGSTRAEYEYLYALRREEESPMLEDFSFLDKVETGYMGGQWDREWVYRHRDRKRRVKKKSGKARGKFNRQFFDEFGPIVHEIREFDVKFDPAPVQHSRLFLTNDWAAICLEYRSSPFGAQFVLANTSRRNAVINGEDTMSFSGTGDSINQILTVLGRGMVTEDGEEVVAENLAQIRRRGKIESEINSTWIQSKKMAQDIANWMRDNFSYGNEMLSVEVFGNPLVEIGDVVSVDYPDKHVEGDFFVLGIQNEFENGLTTSLTLRRRNN